MVSLSLNDVFDDVALGSCFEAPLDQVLVGVLGDDEHGDVGVGGDEASACFGDADARQACVEEHEVWVRLVRQFGELVGGGAIGHDSESELGLQDGLEALADDLVIVPRSRSGSRLLRR